MAEAIIGLLLFIVLLVMFVPESPAEAVDRGAKKKSR
jgi:hypothetical protein